MATKEELKGLGQTEATDQPVAEGGPAEARPPLLLRPGQMAVASWQGQPCHCQIEGGWKRPLVYGLIGAGLGTILGYAIGRLMAK